MQTYRQFITENTQHVEDKVYHKIDNITLTAGSVYYLNDRGHLDRKGGPAVIHPNGVKVWMRNGKIHREDGPAYFYPQPHLYSWYLYDTSIETQAPDRYKWILLKGSIENNFEILNKIGMNTEMQEYVIEHRPDLTSKIKDLDPALKAKYRHEEELGRADL